MRSINYIIIHCSATEAGSDFDVHDIDRWHKAKGWVAVGYHYVIPENGKMRQGRLIEAVRLNLENTEKATEILFENIVEPLKQELYEMRKEMALLRSALRDVKYCSYSANCPIMARLRQSKDSNATRNPAVDRDDEHDLYEAAARCRGPD